MRESRVVLLFSVGLLIATSSYAGCPESPQQLQSYTAHLQRQEVENDPDHAAQIDKALIEMSMGKADDVQKDIKAGLSANATVKTSTIGPNLTHLTQPMSLLTVAVAMCQEEIAEALVKAGASANGGGGDDKGSPLNVAATFGEASLAEFLVKHGADLNQPDIMGDTPLASAVEQHQAAVVSVLLKAGADPNLPLRLGGQKAVGYLEASKEPADQAIAKELIRYGARH